MTDQRCMCGDTECPSCGTAQGTREEETKQPGLTDALQSEMKYMSVKEFVDLGFLFEVNRRVLHPFGLALEVVQEKDGTMSFGGVWDYRDDPEGILFGDEAFKSGLFKWAAFLAEKGAAALFIRKNLLGWIIQRTLDEPVPDEDDPRNW